MCERVIVLSLSVSQSVSQLFCHMTRNGSRRWLAPEDWNKHQNVALDILSPFNVLEFFVWADFFQKQAMSYFRLYDRKRLLVTPPYCHTVLKWVNNFLPWPTLVLLSCLHSLGDLPVRVPHWNYPVGECLLHVFLWRQHLCLPFHLQELHISTCMS